MRLVCATLFMLLVAGTSLGSAGLGALAYGGTDACDDHDHAEHEHGDHGHDHADDSTTEEAECWSESCCASTCSACGCCGLGIASGLPSATPASRVTPTSYLIAFALDRSVPTGSRMGVFRPPRSV